MQKSGYYLETLSKNQSDRRPAKAGAVSAVTRDSSRAKLCAESAMNPVVIERGRVDLTPLKHRRVAILGYGNQGRAHALNLRDSGVSVIVGQRPGPGFQQAVADGFSPSPISATAGLADVVILALPDEAAPAVYSAEVAAALRPGQALGFVHGYNVHYGRIAPPDGLDTIMVAPKGAGYMVRRAFESGAGLPCVVAVHRDASGHAWPLALAWAAGLGAARAMVLQTTFAEETETDLFGEQAAVVGGVTAVMQAAFDTLVAAGYRPEHAYLECVHEVKFVVDLIHAHGLAGMRQRISDTALFGELTRKPRLVEALTPILKSMLAEIRSGRFAEEWSADGRQGRGRMKALLEAERNSQIGRAHV